MSQSKPSKPHFIDLARELLDGELAKGREDCQEGWHHLLNREKATNATVLDVGAGLGVSKERISNCTTQDPNEACPVDTHLEVQYISSKSFDIVSAFDVIEHVVDDEDFLANLLRIARCAVFITTPNYRVSKAANGCHCREYLPAELCWLGVKYLKRLWTGSGNGSTIVERTFKGFAMSEDPHLAVMIFP